MNVRKAGNPVAGIALCLMVVVFATVAGAEPRLAPIDVDPLRAGLKAAEDGKLHEALSWARKIKNPLARKILTWARLTTPDPNADFDEISGFMAANPEWPDQTGLQRRAEEAMNDKTPDAAVLAWFEARKPLTGYGAARLGEALLAEGRQEEGRAMIRDAWIQENFTKAREKAFYKRHRKLLEGADHRRRLDRLQWQGRYWPARRMLWKVPPDYRALGVARLFLRHNRGNVDTAIAKVPAGLKNDAGLKYERLRWRRRRGKFDSAREILNDPPDDLVRPVRWWRERAAVARYTLYQGQARDAYRLARDHGIDVDDDGALAAYAEAEWLAGWIAFRFLNDAVGAVTHFKRMYDAVKYPVSRARGAYWTARAVEAVGQTKDNIAAAETWHRLAALHPTTYYGQLSLAHLRPGADINLASVPKPSDHDTEVFDAHEIVQAVRMLVEVKANEWLRPFVLALDSVNGAPEWGQLTLELAQAAGRPDLSLIIAKREGRESWKFTEAAFPAMIPPPMQPWANAPPLEAPLILAVVRQESAFNVKALSHANAQGLMQLMPHTASRIAKKLKIPYSKHRLTTDAIYNLTLGQAYLVNLLETFQGSYVLALAAYNAGPKRIKQWLRRFGDLRKPDVDSID